VKKSEPIHVFEHGCLTINEVFEKRHLNALLKLNELNNFKYFDSIPNGIKFNHYVGIIQVENLVIEILPKADKDAKDDKWRDNLVEMLQVCRRLKVSTYGDADVVKHNYNLLEIYFSIFLNELSGLIKLGLIKQYRIESSNVNSLKGKLIFSMNTKENLVHKERFYTEHQVYDKDHTLHQILNEALIILDQFTKGTHLYDHCKRVQFDFPEVGKLRVTKKLLDCFQLSRKTHYYAKAFEIARIILLNYHPGISAGKEKMLALLFDMNKLWEEFILIKLREALKDSHSDYEIEGQAQKPFWRSNSLKPDIVIKKRTTNETIVVIDTKWKQPGNSSASSQDLRQMYAYSRYWNAPKAVLLYPGKPLNYGFDRFKPEDGESPEPGFSCKMAFVDVLNIDGKLDRESGKKILKAIEIALL